MADTRFVRGADRLAQRLRTIRQRTGIILNSDAIANLLKRRTLERFEREVDPDGVRWEELKKSTIRRKTYAERKKILQRTGYLKDSIDIIRSGTAGFRGGAVLGVATGAGFRIGVKYGEPARYGRFHQLGAGITRRRFLGIGALDVKAVDSLLRRAIIRASGLR